MIMEIHMLKNYPATNLNRDDTGAPKTCSFGGVQRGRISSQCLKRSWRTSELFAQLGDMGWRSRTLPELVASHLSDLPDEAVMHAKILITGIANKDGKMNDKEMITSQIIFFGTDEVKALADTVRQVWNTSDGIKDFQKKKPDSVLALAKKVNARAITMDIALFGRMVTSDAFMNVESAIQVAHAISTHAVNLESDYFTAVDDLLAETDETGAGMIGDVDYNSCCYYEYASIDLDKLKENLKDSPEALTHFEELVPVLLKVMAQSNPSGKQNTFAGHVLPDAVLVELKTDKIPLSYVNAFAEPVSRYSQHIVKDSTKKLADEIDLMDDCYALPVLHRGWLALRSDAQPKNCERFAHFNQLVEACAAWAKE